ncbi:plasmid mobilization protein [Chitinophaga rhizophila]|uniref:Mobilization protein MobC n=1 Tax=Chitinophaga rhizophila TaxID=2866212 RepID=A0ABS7G700_9BACT|nr:hypothetical protein [Chitinophaga rhizophila]MBW8683433.1 hypothetical protein [Chitinophaga rhizophila]
MNSEKRNKWIHVRLSPSELEKLQARLKKTNCLFLCDFVRRVLLEDKITAFTRSQSLDELIQELVILRKELNYLGKNLNLVTRKLQTDLPKAEMRVWLEENQKGHLALHKKMNDIISRMDFFSQKWLQE